MITRRKHDFVLTYEGANSKFILRDVNDQMLEYFTDVLRFESASLQRNDLVKISVNNNRLCVIVSLEGRSIVCFAPWRYDIPFETYADQLINTVSRLCDENYNDAEIEEIITNGKFATSRTKSAAKNMIIDIE